MDLSPLHAAFDDLEKAVAGVAEKISTAVTDDVSQGDVDQLVDRAKGLAERLAGVTPEAPAPAAAPAPETAPVVDTPAAAPPAGSADAPTWTPGNPSA